MKKIIALLLHFALSNTVYAAGPYDGIYSVIVSGFISGYATVHEVDNKMIVIIVDPVPNTPWEPMIGTRRGDSVSLRSVPDVSSSDINLKVTINFNDNGPSTATINSCVNGISHVCIYPSGSQFNLEKLF
ncbi:hypothetical protein [Nitrosomonas sp. Is37]|uniref:hypothetical protein n=1 Tax=Nitrosomonas sp. Is37 TaxID=3080535 RepID=UPI00294AFD5E|nr:hypothetical protein [Nitrosomonas sp. Is37]MDV6345397.1 hypothetical protein [Nitrosomonas sp. Is37]